MDVKFFLLASAPSWCRSGSPWAADWRMARIYDFRIQQAKACHYEDLMMVSKKDPREGVKESG